MKRIYLLLASLTAIALFACSNDNSISSAEDLNNPQTRALQKVSLSNEEQNPLFGKSIEGLTKISSITDIQPTAATTYIQPMATTTPIQPAASCYTVSGSPSSMYVTNVPYYLSQQFISNVVSFKFSNAPHVLATSHQFTASSYSSSGTFAIDFFRIQCGQYYGDFTPISNSNIYTEAFGNTHDVYADEECLMAFVGRCIGSALGGGYCNFSILGWTGKVCW